MSHYMTSTSGQLLSKRCRWLLSVTIAPALFLFRVCLIPVVVRLNIGTGSKISSHVRPLRLLVTAAAAAAAAAAAHAAAASRNSCIASGSWVMVGVAAEV
jgi:hypothetical protein